MATKLILIQDVEDLGRTGDLVTVKAGYARNYLLPKQKGILADKRALRLQERLQEERRKLAIVDKKDSEETSSRMQGMIIETIVKVDQEGHMFGSVSQSDIVRLLSEKDIQVNRRMVQLGAAIKETGVYTIQLKLKEDVPAEFILKVIPDIVVKRPHAEEATPPRGGHSAE